MHHSIIKVNSVPFLFVIDAVKKLFQSLDSSVPSTEDIFNDIRLILR